MYNVKRRGKVQNGEEIRMRRGREEGMSESNNLL